MTAILLLIFFAFFATMWIVITTVFGMASGLRPLSDLYADLPEAASVTLRSQSGRMGAVGFGGLLDLSVCPSGLRLRVNRVFAPFERPALVPWGKIRVDRRSSLLGPRAVLHLGAPEITKLALEGYVADRLARAAGSMWPEPGPFPRETFRQMMRTLIPGWVAAGLLLSTFAVLNAHAEASDGSSIWPFVLGSLGAIVVWSLARWVIARVTGP